jgi:hypothetical protein
MQICTEGRIIVKIDLRMVCGWNISGLYMPEAAGVA